MLFACRIKLWFALVSFALLSVLSPALHAGKPSDLIFIKIGEGYSISDSRLSSDLTGIGELDFVLNDLNDFSLERTFPYCLPPKPGGTDLAQIFSLKAARPS